MQQRALVLGLALAGPAVAAPVELDVQVRVLDAAGAPVNGAHELVARLYPAEGAGTAAYTATFDDVALQDGFASLRLGVDPALDSAVAAANPWIGLTVDGGAELSRQRAGAVPLAAASFAVVGDVRVTGAPTCASPVDAGRLRYAGGALAVCDGVDFRPLARAVDGSTPERAARTCLEIKRAYPGAPTGTYYLNPSDGPAAEARPYHCDMTTAGGGWTIIASQEAGQFGQDPRNLYDAATPAPGLTAIRRAFFQLDLKQIAAEIRVTNTSGEVATFNTADFTGPLVLDSTPPWVDAGNASWNGIISGDHAVVSHYQVGQACGSASCRQTASVDGGSYSWGLLVVFDWHNGDSSTNLAGHAHFGGNSNIESGWARRGGLLMIR